VTNEEESMNINRLAISMLLSAVLASTSSGLSAFRQAKQIELSSKDPGSKVVTFRVSAKSLLLEPSEGTESTLFRDEAIFTINNKDKTYRVQSYADLLANAKQKAASAGAASDQGVEFKLTDETETIYGFTARKLMRVNRGQPDAEFWMSPELLPPGVRKLGDALRSSLPQNYWARVHGNPGLVELAVLYGVPLRFKADQQTYQARIIDTPESSLELPSGYKKLEN